MTVRLRTHRQARLIANLTSVICDEIESVQDGFSVTFFRLPRGMPCPERSLRESWPTYLGTFNPQPECFACSLLLVEKSTTNT